ncbi:MAG: hypothetical protein VKJ64_20365 [Leptolyngbyaceae bacterium]|nr:hypothetical protein [Leptolyngbyaceae bacterium]
MATTVNLQISLETLVQAIHSLDLSAKHQLLEILEQQIFEAEEAEYGDDEQNQAEIAAVQAEYDRGEYVTLID